MKNLHKALKVFRTFNRLSQTELAKRLKKSKSFISEIESGKRTVQISLVEAYAKEFSVNPSEILKLAEAYDYREYDTSYSSELILKLIDWITNTDTKDDLAVSSGKEKSHCKSRGDSSGSVEGGIAV